MPPRPRQTSIADCRVKSGVERADHRQGQAPERRAAIEAQHRLEASAISAQAASAEPARQARARTARPERRGEIDQRPCRASVAGQEPAANSRAGRRPSATTIRPISPMRRIGPQAHARVRSGRARSAPAAFISAPRAQSSMISPRIAAMPPAASSASRRASMQPPAAAAMRRLAIVHPGERVEHVEEEHEGRDQQPLGAGRAAAAWPSARSAPGRRPRRGRPGGAGCPAHGRCRRRSAAGSSAPRSSAPARRRPGCTAQSLPVQPAGSGAPLMTVQPVSRVRQPRRSARRRCRRCCCRRPGRRGRRPDSPAPAGCRWSGR